MPPPRAPRYTDETAERLAREALARTAPGQTIVCISAPSAFLALHRIITTSATPAADARRIFVLEYDRRFAVYGPSFVHYDYAAPLALGDAGAPLQPGSADFILLDPPFLARECFEKVAQTVRHLARSWGPEQRTPVLACTGRIMRPDMLELLDARETPFHPAHRNGLSNEVGSFANYPGAFAEMQRPPQGAS